MNGKYNIIKVKTTLVFKNIFKKAFVYMVVENMLEKKGRIDINCSLLFQNRIKCLWGLRDISNLLIVKIILILIRTGYTVHVHSFYIPL